MSTNNKQGLLSKETVEFIERVTKVAQMLGIEALIVDKFSARGAQGHDAFIIEPDVPDMEFDALAISRVRTLDRCMDLFDKDDKKFKVGFETFENKQTDVVKTVIFAGSRASLEFRCANPQTLPAIPKAFKDNETVFEFTAKKEDILKCKRAFQALRENKITITCDGKQVFCEIVGLGSDVMTILLSSDVTSCGGDDVIRNLYDAKILFICLSKILQVVPDVPLRVTSKGFIVLKVMDTTVYLIPERGT